MGISKAYVRKGEQPDGCGAISAVHDFVGNIFGSTHAILSKILVQVMGITLIVFGMVQAQNIFSTVTDVGFCTIRDKSLHGSPFPDIIFKGSRDICLTTKWLNISDQSFLTYKKLSLLDS